MPRKLLLVDDSPLVLDALARIAADAGLVVVGRAAHGLAAIELAEALRPDVVSLDVDMPVMNGLTTLKHLMIRRPVPTVMVSALTAEESPITFECLRLGAVDFVEKSASLPLQREEIARRLTAAAAVDPRKIRWARLQRPFPPPSRKAGPTPSRAVAVLAGRPGMAPLLALLNGLPAGYGAGFVVLLDLPAAVVRAFAAYLDRFSSLRVRALLDSAPLLPDTVHLVPVSRPALVVGKGGTPWLSPLDPPRGADPSAGTAHFCTSVFEAFPGRAICVLLAGAPPGADTGLADARRRGLPALCQSPDSATETGALVRALQRVPASATGGVATLLSAVVASLTGAP